MDADSVKNRRYTPDDLPDQLACVYAHEYDRDSLLPQSPLAYLYRDVSVKFNAYVSHYAHNSFHRNRLDSHNFLIGGLISALGLPITVLYTNTFTYLLTY